MGEGECQPDYFDYRFLRFLPGVYQGRKFRFGIEPLLNAGLRPLSRPPQTIVRRTLVCRLRGEVLTEGIRELLQSGTHIRLQRFDHGRYILRAHRFVV
jgi:hypothetical protein